MTVEPVTKERIKIAQDFGLHNVGIIAEACRRVGIPFYVACALFQKESGGLNVYGHDSGGALAGYPNPVTKSNFEVFWWLVVTNGQTSNGVGPSQITYAGSRNRAGRRDGGFFQQMLDEGLKPWRVEDNMVFGLRLLKGYHDKTKSWVKAGTSYNGAEEYGQDLSRKVAEWKKRLGVR